MRRMYSENQIKKMTKLSSSKRKSILIDNITDTTIKVPFSDEEWNIISQNQECILMTFRAGGITPGYFSGLYYTNRVGYNGLIEIGESQCGNAPGDPKFHFTYVEIDITRKQFIINFDKSPKSIMLAINLNTL